MTTSSSTSLKEVFLQEAWGDLENQSAGDFENSVKSLGISIDDSLQLFTSAVDAAKVTIRRQRYEAAKMATRVLEKQHPIKLVSYDMALKKEIFAQIQACAANTGIMTIAARNRTITGESDIDAFLEACLRLGLIDADGNLIVEKG